ncbi:MAG TPA: glutamate-cysteine ligase family protein [Kofleriaceae bacterium]|jgi:CBS domain-containing protein|nr:glutamate-cysteine ligase family protein [Kofleriaceae bacterium]
MIDKPGDKPGDKATRAHKDVGAEQDEQKRREFMHAMLADLRALDRMLRDGLLETGPRRIGAEQEMFLIDRNWGPARASLQMIEKLADPHYTTELGQFQLEANADPQLFSGNGLSRMEAQLDELVAKARVAAAELGLAPVLMGILPTLRKADLGLDGMVPSPRYRALNKAMADMRGGAFEFSINGTDELIVRHDSVMLEACNASFQVHLQVTPEEFSRMYNIAQVLAGPMVAIAANSPLLFGRRLWAETRIALFRQAVDTRSHAHHLRESEARVSFGTRWVRESVLEIYQEDIARFRTLVGTDLDEDPQAKLARGETPLLKALRLHNGTIYRWNRACYGVMAGKAHLRIENRVMPAGPSVLDEVANGALWFGVMAELGAREEDVTRRIEFDQAGANFYSAAREGLGTHFIWLDGEDLTAAHLVLDRLLPLAEAGLRRQAVDEADIKRYLAVVDARVRSARTGARWLLSSWNALKDKATSGERSNALVAATVQRQQTGRPVAEWERARLDEAEQGRANYQQVDQYMTTDLFTVHASDPVEMVVNLMSWERIRHVPVENNEHRLVGLVTYRAVLRFLANGGSMHDTPVSAIMKTDVLSVSVETRTLDAIMLMRRYRYGCLPVLQDGHLVGILTEEDFMNVASKLLEQQLGEARP